MVSYMPPGDSTLLYMDVQGLRDSGHSGETGRLDRGRGAGIQEVHYRNWLRLPTDLDSVLSSTSDVQQLFLLKGRFDWKSLIKYANPPGGACVNGFCRIPSDLDNRTAFLVLPDWHERHVSGISKDAVLRPATSIRRERSMRGSDVPRPADLAFSPGLDPAGHRANFPRARNCSRGLGGAEKLSCAGTQAAAIRTCHGCDV